MINAIVHRDYMSPSDIVIKVFDDRIQFINPGSLPEELTIEEFEKDNYPSVLRNKLIAEAFYLAGRIEKYGSGFVRIRRILKDRSDIHIQFDELSSSFSVSCIKQLPATPQVEKLARIVVGEMTRDEIQRALGLSDREHFRKEYIRSALDCSVLEMTQPDKPKSKTQKYRLTIYGQALKRKLSNP